MKTKRLYRVVSVHPVTHGSGTTITKTRHFQSKQAAEGSAKTMREGIDRDPWGEDDGYHLCPAISVRIDVSDPITFPADTEGATS